MFLYLSFLLGLGERSCFAGTFFFYVLFVSPVLQTAASVNTSTAFKLKKFQILYWNPLKFL